MATFQDFLTGGSNPAATPSGQGGAGANVQLASFSPTGQLTGGTPPPASLTGAPAAFKIPNPFSIFGPPITNPFHGFTSLLDPNTWAAALEHALFGLLKDAGVYIFHVLMRPVFWLWEFFGGIMLMWFGIGILFGFSKTGQQIAGKIAGVAGSLAMFVK